MPDMRIFDVLKRSVTDFNALRAGDPDLVIDLTGAKLAGCSLVQANLRGADIRGADLCWTDLSGADLRDALLNWSDFFWANLADADLDGADLGGANFANARGMRRGDFERSVNATRENVAFVD